MKKRQILLSIFFVVFLMNSFSVSLHAQNQKRWTQERANQWYAKQPWLAGCNFQPSTAINQIEMWAGSTFDAATIDKELGWAEELGFNLMRVYLSSEVWKEDPSGLKDRMDKYLTISTKHGIKTMFVLFDDCWNPETQKGVQPEPRPGIHNSGWVQDPACSLRKDTATLFPVLEKYVKDIISTYKNDERILVWDLYNEPGNSDHGITTLPLLKNTFKWAREAIPSQPITAGLWFFKVPELNQFQAENSDIFTYHNYGNLREHQTWINLFQAYGRPMICTEYMARRNNSLFQNIMPLLKQNNIGAINWGFVAGKTNTIFAWDEPDPEEKEPKLWFHDIYRQDKSAFDSKEVEFIKKMTGKENQVRLLEEADFDATVDGKKVSLYTLKNRQGMVAQITNFGGRIASLWAIDKEGNYSDVVAGCKTLAEYQKANEVYLGALIGRYGNRIGNSKFSLGKNTYKLKANDGKNQLHGGPKGFQNVVWDANLYKNEKGEDVLELTYLSKDKEEGYPGNLNVKVIYTLTNSNELRIDYSALTDKPTVVNLTHHSFFNLHGFSSGKAKSINSHLLRINGDSYTPTNETLIPTGEIRSVEGAPFDFRQSIKIGERVDENNVDLKYGKGYDHNWVLNKKGGEMSLAAEVYEPSNGRVLTVFTSEPALQFYGGNFFQGKDKGKYGEVYEYRTSFALETQHYPDSPNHPNFPTTQLNPGEKYKHTCIYKFSVR